MGQMFLHHKLLALMPRFAWPYLNVLLAFAGADVHFHDSNQNANSGKHSSIACSGRFSD